MKKGFIRIDRDLCKGCGLCIEACPKGSIEISENLNLKGYHPAEYTEDEGSNDRVCTGCTLCAKRCPEEIISGEQKAPHQLEQDKCIKCGICYEACIFDAVVVK